MESKWLKVIAINMTIITVLLVLAVAAKVCVMKNKYCVLTKKACVFRKTNIPTHFEFITNDVAKAQKFYGDVFGWEFKYDKDKDYTMIKFAKKYPVCGGLMKRPKEVPMPTTTMYFTVENLEDTVAKVEKAGGKVLKSKTEIKGWGWFAVCADSEGAHFGIWQDDPNKKYKRY